MVNERAKRGRQGQQRPFPEERAARAAALADERAQTSERVARHRQRSRIEEERARGIRVEDAAAEAGGEADIQLTRRALASKVNRVIEVLESQLISCHGPSSRTQLLDALWSHPLVKLNLPDFYLPPKEAKAQMELLENLTNELNAVKGVQSKDMLVVRGALLSAAVSTEVTDVRAIARILKTRTVNVKNARYRRRALEESGSSVWAAPRRRQRFDVLSKVTVNAVRVWWTTKTRVSLNKKEVVRKRIPSSKTVEEHATHYLLESQVRLLL